MPFKNYEGFCHKKGFLQGSINYHMNDVLESQRRRRNLTSETKSTYHRVIYLEIAEYFALEINYSTKEQ